MPWRDTWRPEAGGDRRTFQLIAEGLAQLVGFGAAAINVVRGDEVEVVAVAGVDTITTHAGDTLTADELLGARWPLTVLEDALVDGEEWGRFRFVAHTAETGPRGGWVRPGSTAVPSGPDAWHPADVLIAPVRDAGGVLRGAVWLDDPVGGRRPNDARRRLMDKYAEHAQRAILTALERERLEAQARLLDTARTVVRQASRERTLDAVLRETGETLRGSFRATALWTRVFSTGSEAPEVVQYFADGDLRRDVRMAGISERAARRLWEQGAATAVELGATSHDLLSPQDLDYVRAFLEREGYAGLLCAPLGAGPECLGSLAILRPRGAARFRRHEIDGARDIGRDLGRVLLTARTFQEEQRLVARLRELDAYKSQVVTRMADELSTPLKAIVHCVDQLRTAGRADPVVVAELRERSDRMARLVDELLLLARIGDRLDAARVDLAATVAAVVDRIDGTSRLEVYLPAADAAVSGDAVTLDWLVATMVETALTYGADGPTQVVVRPGAGEVELVVTTTGGDVEELRGLLRRYFGSADPRVLDQPGTGVWLTLVDAIVRRHGGVIALHDGPGAGLCVTFPATE